MAIERQRQRHGGGEGSRARGLYILSDTSEDDKIFKCFADGKKNRSALATFRTDKWSHVTRRGGRGNKENVPVGLGVVWLLLGHSKAFKSTLH